MKKILFGIGLMFAFLFVWFNLPKVLNAVNPPAAPTPVPTPLPYIKLDAASSVLSNSLILVEKDTEAVRCPGGDLLVALTGRMECVDGQQKTSISKGMILEVEPNGADHDRWQFNGWYRVRLPSGQRAWINYNNWDFCLIEMR